VTDGSGERFEGPNSVGGSDRIDPDPPTGVGPYQPGPTESMPGCWEPHRQPSSGMGEPQAPPTSGEWGVEPRPADRPGQAPSASEAGRWPIGPPVLGWPPTPKVRKSRKRLVVLLAAGAAVVGVVAIVLLITRVSGGGEHSRGSAGDVVKGYLDALARGDAETALSYGIDQPASSEFLTGDILKKQVAQWPIRNIRILHDNSMDPGAALSMAHVHVVATFGDNTSDAIMELRMDHNHWKLASAAIKFTPGLGASMGNAAAKTVTVFGKPIGDSTVYVFPGWIDLGTTNPYMSVSIRPFLLDQLTMLGGVLWVHPTFALSEKGSDAVEAQLAAAMANCQKSNLLAPPGCPVHLDPYGLAEGTAAWGSADLSAVNLENFDLYHLTLMFSGQITVPVTVKTISGATNQVNATDLVSGTADIGKTPPELNFR
jgi:hypothetical protein